MPAIRINCVLTVDRQLHTPALSKANSFLKASKLSERKRRDVYAVRRHDGILCTQEQPGAAVLKLGHEQQAYGGLAVLFLSHGCSNHL